MVILHHLCQLGRLILHRQATAVQTSPSLLVETPCRSSWNTLCRSRLLNTCDSKGLANILAASKQSFPPKLQSAMKRRVGLRLCSPIRKPHVGAEHVGSEQQGKFREEQIVYHHRHQHL